MKKNSIFTLLLTVVSIVNAGKNPGEDSNPKRAQYKRDRQAPERTPSPEAVSRQPAAIPAAPHPRPVNLDRDNRTIPNPEGFDEANYRPGQQPPAVRRLRPALLHPALLHVERRIVLPAQRRVPSITEEPGSTPPQA